MKRISSIPGVTVLEYWQAPKYTPGGMREVRAIAWHMAQGGGTDTWLTRKDGAQGNNSCHIVVKYSGAIRQIVEFDDASWSLHISYDSDTNDAPDFGIFGLQYVKNALGSGWPDPNRYIIAIEVEGFAADGPNPAQKTTIRRLAEFLEREYPKAVHLGHRDFQDYKPCPGRYMFTNLLPHAGRFDNKTTTQEDFSMKAVTTITPKLIDIAVDATIYDLNGQEVYTNHIDRTGDNATLSPFGCGTVSGTLRWRAFYLDPDGAGDENREVYLARVDDSHIHDLPEPEIPAPLDPNLALLDRIAALELAIEKINTIADEAA